MVQAKNHLSPKEVLSMLSSNVKYVGLDVHKEEFDPHKVGSDQCIASLKSAQTVDVDCVEVPSPRLSETTKQEPYGSGSVSSTISPVSVFACIASRCKPQIELRSSELRSGTDFASSRII